MLFKLCQGISLSRRLKGALIWLDQGLNFNDRFERRKSSSSLATSKLKNLYTDNINTQMLRYSSGSEENEAAFRLQEVRDSLKQFQWIDNDLEEHFDPTSLKRLVFRKPQRSNHFKGKGLAVLTSGGDSCGMNAAVRAIVRTAIFYGFNAFVIREGYEGLMQDYIEPADWTSVSGIIHKGGTAIGSSRSMAFLTKKGRTKAAQNLTKRKINHLVVIGGDGSLTGADMFRKEWDYHLNELVKNGLLKKEDAHEQSHLNIIGLVGSIDNDFWGPDLTIGVDTALTRICDVVETISSTAESHKRTFVLEIMGRNCGYLTLLGGIICDADYIIIPEFPPSTDWATDMCNTLLKEKSKLKSRKSLIMVCEFARDESGKLITVQNVMDEIKSKLKWDCRSCVLGHIQRGGKTTALDRIIASRMGAEAVRIIAATRPNESPLVLSIKGTSIIALDLEKCVSNTSTINQAMKDNDFKKIQRLRGTDFQRLWKTYNMIHTAREEKEESLKFGVVCMGTPACGANGIVATFVRSMAQIGHKVYGVRNGLQGLLSGNAHTLEPRDVYGWMLLGGSKLGSSLFQFEKKNVHQIIQNIRTLNLRGLLIIGDFKGFRTLLDFAALKKEYSELQIPMLLIPTSINNNIPGTSLTVGSDTALNAIVDDCDRIRQSAEGTPGRVFVIQTMGSYCGYLATAAALACGADSSYIFEEKFGVDTILHDIQFVKQKMQKGVKRAIILRNENASDVLTADCISRIFASEGSEYFTVRQNILGHSQQGMTPSPVDRMFAAKLGVKAAEYFSKVSSMSRAGHHNIVLGIQEKDYILTPIEDLIEKTDFEFEIPREQWWFELRALTEVLGKNADWIKN